MTVEYIYIARHGYRMNWVTNDWVSVTSTPRDPPLAAFGLNQAQEMADYFLSLPEERRPTAIFSSPYSKPTAEALELPLYIEHGLSEWYSPVAPGTGLHPRPLPATTLRSHVPEVDDAWQSIYYPARKGEDVSEVYARSQDLMRALIPAIERHFGGKHKRILLVSHAATVIALTRALVGDRELPIRVGCCTLTDLAPQDPSSNTVGNWEAKKLADAAHLKDGLSRDWGFEDVVIVDGKVINHSGEPGTENEVDEPVGLQVHLLPSELRAYM